MAIPVSLADAKRQLRHYDEALSAEREAEIQTFMGDAAAWVERYTGHILVARDVTETFPSFEKLQLRAWPIKPSAVPVITYPDAANQAVAVTDVKLSTVRRPALALLWAGARWPSVACGTTVSVTVRAGYEPGDAVPLSFRRAMLVLIGGYDADREGGEVFAKAEAAAKRLCSDYRARAL